VIRISGDSVEVTVPTGDAEHQKVWLLQEVGERLHFPSYYGQNLDALADCLSDLAWIEKPTVALIIREFNLLPQPLQVSLIDVFQDAESAHPSCKLTVLLID
jgi:RNAse (barnase) inhibitor barstar